MKILINIFAMLFSGFWFCLMAQQPATQGARIENNPKTTVVVSSQKPETQDATVITAKPDAKIQHSRVTATGEIQTEKISATEPSARNTQKTAIPVVHPSGKEAEHYKPVVDTKHEGPTPVVQPTDKELRKN